MGQAHRVVILGGGFGGLYAGQAMRRSPVRITLIDQRNFHLFQPLLYQVATGDLSAANIAAPLREIFRKQKNVRVLMGEATGIDLHHKRVALVDGQVDFDTLIVATGSTHTYFGNDQWAAHAPPLKTIEHAKEIRRRVLLAFENAEREDREQDIRVWLNFVIVGGGPTGVELAGALAEIAHTTLRGQFFTIDPADAKIYLIQSGDHILDNFSEALSAKAQTFLEQLGVTVWTNSRVIDVQKDFVVVRGKDGEQKLSTRTVLWGAGVRASPLGAKLMLAAGLEPHRSGRVPVEADMSLPGHPDVFVVGDLAMYTHHNGEPLPGVATVAMQQGRYVAKLIDARRRGRRPPTFKFRDRGMMATIGRKRAIAMIRGWELAGFFAWIIWLFVHLLYVVGFANRLIVLIQWGWKYITGNRPARLITGDSALDLIPNDEPAPPDTIAPPKP